METMPMMTPPHRMASPDTERGDRWEKVLRACVKAERALEARNAALLNSR